MVNNFEQIKGLLQFRTENDFYFVQILQRKKDHKDGAKVNGSNNNARLIKAYYVKSLEHFEFLEKEIIELCEVFNARAGINLNRRSFKKMQLKTVQKLIQQLVDGTHNKVHKAYNSVVGAHNDDSDKRWILDIDYPLTGDEDDMVEYINELRPLGEKVITKIPSKNGYHLITKPFQLNEFKDHYSNVEVHKNNPTNLYIP